MFLALTFDWVPACDGFAIVACRDAGMAGLRELCPTVKAEISPGLPLAYL